MDNVDTADLCHIKIILFHIKPVRTPVNIQYTTAPGHIKCLQGAGQSYLAALTFNRCFHTKFDR